MNPLSAVFGRARVEKAAPDKRPGGHSLDSSSHSSSQPAAMLASSNANMLRSARAAVRLAARSPAVCRPRRAYATPSSSPIPALEHNTSPSAGYGQPLPFSHPHLLAPGELSIGIQASEYEQRRRALMAGLEEGAVVIVAGGRIKYMSANIFYKFRQASNMAYLTAWDEPNSTLVLGTPHPARLGACEGSLTVQTTAEKTSTSRGYKMTMFVPPKDKADEMWHGPRSGIEGACEVFGADEVRHSTNFIPRALVG